MHGFTTSKHFMQRAQQRGVPYTVVHSLVYYGERRKSVGGADRIYFTKESLRDVHNDFGRETFRMCERYKRAYLVISDDGIIITVAHAYRKTVH